MRTDLHIVADHDAGDVQHREPEVGERPSADMRLVLRQYEQLFEEKLELFAELLTEEPVTWSGETRPPLKEQSVYPPTQLHRDDP